MTTNNITNPALYMDLTSFDGFEISGVKKLYESSTSQVPYVCEECDDEEADFFSLYGHYDPTDFNNGIPYSTVGLERLLDFSTRRDAEMASRYFSAYRQVMIIAQEVCDIYYGTLGDEEISTATDVIEVLMEAMEALEISLVRAEGQ